MLDPIDVGQSGSNEIAAHSAIRVFRTRSGGLQTADLDGRFGKRPSLLVPANLTAFVLFFEPGLKRLEVIRHGASRDIFAGRVLQDFAPVFGAPFPKDVIEPFPDLLV